MTDIEKLKELEAKATPAWETYSDPAYYDCWAVRRVGETSFDKTFHLASGDEARMLVAFLNEHAPSLASKDAEIERLKAERENARSEASHVAKMFLRHRDLLLEIRDKIADESDRCYFGSTNHADYFRDVAAEMDDYAWDRYMRATKWPDYIEKSRKANTRAEAAETRLTTALAALGEARKALRVCERQLRYVGNGTEDPAIHDTAETARAALAKLNALEGNEDGTR